MKAIQERGFLSGYNRYVWAVIVLQVAGGLVSTDLMAMETCMQMDESIDEYADGWIDRYACRWMDR